MTDFFAMPTIRHVHFENEKKWTDLFACKMRDDLDTPGGLCGFVLQSLT